MQRRHRPAAPDPAAVARSPGRPGAAASVPPPLPIQRARSQLAPACCGHRPRAEGDHRCAHTTARATRRRTGASSRRPLSPGASAHPHLRAFFRSCAPAVAPKMRIIAVIADPSTIRDILLHLGDPSAPPRIAPARGPPPWDLPDCTTGEFDPHSQPAPEVEFDQRLAWQTPTVDRLQRATPARCVPMTAGTRRELRDACESARRSGLSEPRSEPSSRQPPFGTGRSRSAALPPTTQPCVGFPVRRTLTRDGSGRALVRHRSAEMVGCWMDDCLKWSASSIGSGT